VHGVAVGSQLADRQLECLVVGQTQQPGRDLLAVVIIEEVRRGGPLTGTEPLTTSIERRGGITVLPSPAISM
jgi:hypothetical protein